MEFRAERQILDGHAGIATLKPVILIVDDDKAARESLRMVLETYGFEIRELASGEELMVPGTLDGCACMILDVNLPGANGIETLERLRAAGTPVPAVLVSGRATKEMRVQAIRLSALAFFEKPIDIEALLAVVGSTGS